MSSKDTKSALLDYAEDLVRQVGVNSMSYNDLSEAVGIRKASIHYHFPKKDDLIKALLDRCSVAYAEHYRAVVDSNIDSHEKLNRLAEIFENGVRDNRICLIGMLSVDYPTLSQKVKNTLNTTIAGTVRIFEKAILQGVQENVISIEYSTYDIAYSFLSFLLGAQILFRCSNDPVGFRNAARAYIGTVTK